MNSDTKTNNTPIENRIFYFIPSILIFSIWAVYMTFSENWHQLFQHWHISLTMVFGSLVAGATSEGGGAIAFPIFTKVLNIKPEIARNFSLAIQTIGMGTASIVILKYKIKIIKPAIIFSSIGGVFGIVVGTYYIAPLLPAAYFKIAFTVLTASFGFVLFLENLNLKTPRFNNIKYDLNVSTYLLLLVGFFGGICTSIVGNGIDFLTFSLLVTYYNISEKIATPTSVILMAINAAAGFFLQAGAFNSFEGVTFDYWLVCIPIVIFGAPIGALICEKISRTSLIYFLLSLIAIELISTILIVKFDATSRIMAPVLFCILVFIFFLLNRLRMSKLHKMGLIQKNNSEKEK